MCVSRYKSKRRKSSVWSRGVVGASPMNNETQIYVRIVYRQALEKNCGELGTGMDVKESTLWHRSSTPKS